MPSWDDLFNEIKSSGGTHDILRRKYLKKLQQVTGRNIIVYYSSFLQKPELGHITAINDNDKNGFMNAIKGLDPDKGLDLLLHTQGGEMAATESLVHYLRSKFGIEVRAIIPQIAMSGGTMIACSCKSIVMGRQSNLGPYDPQYKGVPARGVIEEFNNAMTQIRADPEARHVWQPIIAKYNPTMIGECQRAITWSEQMMRDWLRTGMFAGQQNIGQTIDTIIQELGDQAMTLSHSRHISVDKCEDMGLNIERMEQSQKLQDAILSVHHIMMLTLTDTPAIKIIENHLGKAFVQTAVVRQVGP